MISYIWDTTAPKGLLQSASAIPVRPHLRHGLPVGPGRSNRWVRETHNVAADYERAYKRPAPRVKGSAPPDQFAAHRHYRRKLLRRSCLPQRAAGMVLVTGGAGSSAAISWKDSPRSAAGARSCAPPDGSSSWRRSGSRRSSHRRWNRGRARGATTVIHVAGVTKALSAGRLLCRQHARDRTTGARRRGHGIAVRPRQLARGDRPEPGWRARSRKTPNRIPSAHYGKSKLEAEHVVRKLLPDAVIVRPPVVYGPRDTGVFRLLQIHLAGSGARNRRWRAMVQRHLRRMTWWTRCSPPRKPPKRLAATTSRRTRNLPHWHEFGALAARIMSRRPRRMRIPIRHGTRGRAGGEVWSRLTRKPGIISRDKIAEARCPSWLCDTRRAAAELGISKLQHPLEAGSSRTLAWYKEAGWLKY